MKKNPFPPGKLPPEILAGLLKRFSGNDPRVVVGPQPGEDAAVIDMGDRFLVAKTDPITFATERIGRYLVNINANDIACMGADPKWLLVTCLLPEGKTDAAVLADLFGDLSDACDELGITVCGGHTEVTLGLDRTLLVGQLLGEVGREDLVDKRRVRPGDLLLLTKGIAVEGTSVMARERGDLLERSVPGELLARARGLLTDPGISVLPEARVSLASAGRRLHGMHDPTEGGLWQGLHEIADRAGVGVRVEQERVPVLPECSALCSFFGIDPMGLLASGALLMAVDPLCETEVARALGEEGIPCARIGEVRPEAEGRIRVCGGRELPLPQVIEDELIKALRKDAGSGIPGGKR
jgi:hydrogenase maturation factor